MLKRNSSQAWCKKTKKQRRKKIAMFSKKSSKGERSYKELHISISSTFHTLRILIRLYDESSSWILFFTLQYYVLQVCLISSTLPWAPHIAIIRSRMKKGKFNALVRNHIHWAIWEHHLRSQVRISFEIYIYIYIYITQATLQKELRWFRFNRSVLQPSKMTW
jgi:hypothetical protein